VEWKGPETFAITALCITTVSRKAPSIKTLNIMPFIIVALNITTMENVRQVVARVVLSVFMRKYFIFRVSFFKPSIKIVSAGKY